MNSLLLATLIATPPAHACGGFFCSSGGSTTTTTTTTQTGDYGIVPVVQSAERILFRVNDDETITTFVEVGFVQRDDVDFAWIIPIPDAIPVEEVSTADAGLFNALEMATAPTFTFQWEEVVQNQVPGYNYNYSYSGYYGRPGGGACNTMGCAADTKVAAGDAFRDTGLMTTSFSTTQEEQIGVEVLEDAVVGPFAIEVIQAIDATEFSLWLGDNGYDMPDAAHGPLQHYIDEGMSFLGVKLAPDVPEGPVDTLVFTCPAEAPTIPLILTAIASENDLGITAYVLGNDPYVPANWETTRDFTPEVLPVGGGQTDYLARVQAETGVHDGQAFVLEYSGDTDVLEFEDLIVNATIKQYPTLTRYRGEISPWEMTLDPWFAPFPGLQPYSRDHSVWLSQAPPDMRSRGRSRGPDRSEVRGWFRGDGAMFLLAPLALLGWFRRREL